MRDPLSRVKGLGSAKEGVEHWAMQRLTAIAMIPLSGWVLYSLPQIAAMDFNQARAFVSHPINAVLLSALAISVFYHLQLGLQVVVEDYIHARWQEYSLLIAIRFGAFLAVIASLLAILRVALGTI